MVIFCFQTYTTMKKLSIFFLGFIFLNLTVLHSTAQSNITTPTASHKSMVMQRLGLTDITIRYHSPSVKSREIWGKLVPYNEVWRCGAEENTTIEFSTDVKIEGQTLKAGKYGFHTIPTADEWTIIFSNNHTSWGSYFYAEKEDALRVKVKPTSSPMEEWLKYDFNYLSFNSLEIALKWEKLKVAFKVEADVHTIVLANMRNQLRGIDAFYWEGWAIAAQYCLQNNINYEEALQWANSSIQNGANFTNTSLKAQLLEKLGKKAEADQAMKEALQTATVLELHGYGRQLLSQKKNKEAFEVFQMNVKKNPNKWPVNVGMARGYSAMGDYKNALKHAKLALEQAPDQLNKNSLESMIKTLQANKDVN